MFKLEKEKSLISMKKTFSECGLALFRIYSKKKSHDQLQNMQI